MKEKVNPRRYGERTWFDDATHKFAMFNALEARAIAAYLAYKSTSAEITDFERDNLQQAILNYWKERARAN